MMMRVLEILNETIIQREEMIGALRDKVEYLEEQNNDMYNEISRLKTKLNEKENVK